MKSLKLKNSLENFLNFDIQYGKKKLQLHFHFFLYSKFPNSYVSLNLNFNYFFDKCFIYQKRYHFIDEIFH